MAWIKSIYTAKGIAVHSQVVHCLILTLFCGIVRSSVNYDQNLSNTTPYSDDTDGSIPVNIRIKPAHYLHGKVYISTSNNLTATAEILDEKFRNVTLTYQWSIKDKTITTDTNASQIVYKFDSPDEAQFLKVLVFHPKNDTGTSQKDLVVRDPVTIAEPGGRFFLEHGDLLDIKLKFNGTRPYLYCYKICHDKAEPECGQCQPELETVSTEVPVLKYLHRIGNYTMNFVVSNVASQETKKYVIRITGSLSPQPLPIVPIVSSISAVVILLVGVAFHLKFKSTILTETADFDFVRQVYDDREEEFWDEEQSFFQRVRYILFSTERDLNSSLSDSNLSSSRARLVI